MVAAVPLSPRSRSKPCNLQGRPIGALADYALTSPWKKRHRALGPSSGLAGLGDVRRRGRVCNENSPRNGLPRPLLRSAGFPQKRSSLLSVLREYPPIDLLSHGIVWIHLSGMSAQRGDSVIEFRVGQAR